LNSFIERFAVTFTFLSAGVIVVEFSEALTFVVYFLLAFYLSLKFYELQDLDTPDGLMVLTAFLNSLVSVSVVIAVGSTQPQVFSQVSFYYSLFTLNIITTFATTFGTAFFSGNKKLLLYVNAAFLAWGMNYAGLLGFLYAKGFTPMAFRIVAVAGHYPVVMWGLPYISLWVMIITAAITIYGSSNKKEEKKKLSTSTELIEKKTD